MLTSGSTAAGVCTAITGRPRKAYGAGDIQALAGRRAHGRLSCARDSSGHVLLSSFIDEEG